MREVDDRSKDMTSIRCMRKTKFGDAMGHDDGPEAPHWQRPTASGDSTLCLQGRGR